jgi:hypothetical protein
LSEATVNTASGNIVSESRVEVKLPRVNQGQSCGVMENGVLILFGGGVETTFNPDQVRPDPQDLSTSRCSRASFGSARASHPPVPRPHDGKTRK